MRKVLVTIVVLVGLAIIFFPEDIRYPAYAKACEEVGGTPGTAGSSGTFVCADDNSFEHIEVPGFDAE